MVTDREDDDEADAVVSDAGAMSGPVSGSGSGSAALDSTGPGAAFRSSREALDVSCREVAETLNLPLRTIEAMEANDFEELPASVFARGYIRSYARLLELDPEALVASYLAASGGDEPTPPGDQPDPRREWIQNHPELLVGIALGSVLVIVLALSIVFWPSTDPSDEEVQAGPDAGGARVVDGGEPTEQMLPERTSAQRTAETIEGASRAEPSPAATVVTPADAPVAKTESVPIDNAAPPTQSETVRQGAEIARQAAETARQAAETARQAAPRPDAGAPGFRRITAAGEDRLQFEFTEDCWVEVKAADGSRLYSDLSRAGRQLGLLGQGPFRILLGYAPGASLSFNGERVPLAPHTRNNVATLVLGQ